jgi:hypothetical protein
MQKQPVRILYKNKSFGKFSGYVIYNSAAQLFLPTAHQTLKMAREGTPQNFSL